MQTSVNTGSQNIATEARVLTRYVLLLRQPAGLNLYRAGILPANLYLLTPSAPFTLQTAQEAVQSAQSLRTWKQALDRGDTRLTVVFGTKGGRHREAMILEAVAVRKALDNALAVAEDRHGRLIDKPDLKSAMKYWHSQASRLGLTGAYSPYSLRYAWALDVIRNYLAQGFGEKEALAMTALDLGHGDGRGRYGAQVYGRRDTD